MKVVFKGNVADGELDLKHHVFIMTMKTTIKPNLAGLSNLYNTQMQNCQVLTRRTTGPGDKMDI